MKKIIACALALFNIGLVCGQSLSPLEKVVEHVSHTPYATYERGHFSYKGVPILQNQFTIRYSLDGRKLRSRSSLTEAQIAALPPMPSGPYLYHRDNNWFNVIVDTVLNGSLHYALIHHSTFKDSLYLNAHQSDTLVTGKVFNPDPLTPYNLTYGGPYTDMNDQNGATLDTLTQEVDLLVSSVNDTLRLENDFVKVLDFDAPYLGVSNQPSEWIAGRAPAAFEQIMTLYHITYQNQYLHALGYDSLLNYAIHVDAQALNGQDNSLFNWGFATPRLYFGEGGVDDAEDADVIIHELGHAISHAASPNSNMGVQRSTYDEALGDYFAERYGRLQGISSTRVFDWDGNNPFWSGRSLIYDGFKDYNSISFGSIYSHTDLVVSAMLEFSNHANVNDSVADKIIIESLHTILPFDNLRQIAREILATDSLITGGAYQNIIYQSFGPPKNILPQQSTENKVVKAVSTPECRIKDGGYQIVFPQAGDYDLHAYSLSGQLLWVKKSLSGSINLQNGLPTILKIQDSQGQLFTLRLL